MEFLILYIIHIREVYIMNDQNLEMDIPGGTKRKLSVTVQIQGKFSMTKMAQKKNLQII